MTDLRPRLGWLARFNASASLPPPQTRGRRPQLEQLRYAVEVLNQRKQRERCVAGNPAGASKGCIRPPQFGERTSTEMIGLTLQLPFVDAAAPFDPSSTHRCR